MTKQMIAAIMAICLLLSALVGCSQPVTTIATLNGVEIPIGYYTAQQMQMRVQLEAYYGDNYEEHMSAPSEIDPTKTNAQVHNENYRKAFELLYLMKLKVEELGLEMDEYRKQYFEQEYEYFKKAFNSMADYRLFLKKANMTEEEHKQIYMESTYYSDLIYAHYYDPEQGVERFDETKVRPYFDSLVDYSIQHILFAYGDDKDAAKAEAENVIDRLRADEIEFTDAMNEYSDDSDLAYYPYGYGFVEYEEGFPAVFTDAAKELAVNEYGLYESEYGYHIIMRISNDRYFTIMQEVYEKAYGNQLLQEKYNAWLEELDFQYNPQALEAFDFAKPGRTNVNLRKQSQ